MASRQLGAALKAEGLKPREKLLLIMMADAAEGTDGEFRFAPAKFTRLTGMDASRVMEAAEVLVGKGLIDIKLAGHSIFRAGE